MIEIDIKNALKHYNAKNYGKKPELKLDALAKKVITDGRMNDNSKMIAMTSWQYGNYQAKACTVDHLESISKITGYPICKLIKQSK